MKKKINKNSDFNQSVEHYKKGLMVSSKKKTAILITAAATIVTFGALGGGHYIYKATHPPVVDIDKWVVKFDTDGGTKLNDVQVDKGGKLEQPKDPIKDHFVFKGWFLNKELTKPCVFPLTINENTTLYAKWNNMFNVNFYSRGTKVDSVEIENGTKLEKPKDPALSELTFDGWYLDEDCTLRCMFPITINQETNIYLKWNAVFTFESNGGTTILPITYKYGQTTVAPTDPTKKYFTFKGWYENAKFEGEPFTFNTPATKSTKLYAKYEQTECTVTWVFDNGQDPKVDDNVKIGTKLSAYSPEPTRERFKFVGWFKDIERKNQWDFDTDVVKGNTTLYAKWESQQYRNVYFYYGTDEKGEVHYDTVEVVKDSTVDRPATPTYTGYTFDNWYTDGEFGTRFDFTKGITEDTVVYAKWTQQAHYVTEQQYKESFENLVNITETRDLNYGSNGYIAKHTDGKTDFSIRNLRVSKDSQGDRETFLSETDDKTYFTIKNGRFYTYATLDSQYIEGVFDSFRPVNVRDQIAEVVAKLYESYQYFTYADNLFTYKYQGTEGSEKYDIDMTLYFSSDKKLERINCAHIHNNVEIDMYLEYYYETQVIPIPTGRWQYEVTERTHSFKSASASFISTERLSSEYYKGNQILNLTNDVDDVNVDTLRLFGGTTSRVYSDILADNCIIYKNGTLLVKGTDFKESTIDDKKAIKFTNEIVKGDTIEMIVNIEEEPQQMQYFFEFE